jgi:hypothetical protein
VACSVVLKEAWKVAWLVGLEALLGARRAGWAVLAVLLVVRWQAAWREVRAARRQREG